ncbi:hypothetical protein Dimus_029614 [Dionaea muscipula]
MFRNHPITHLTSVLHRKINELHDRKNQLIEEDQDLAFQVVRLDEIQDEVQKVERKIENCKWILEVYAEYKENVGSLPSEVSEIANMIRVQIQELRFTENMLQEERKMLLHRY